MKSLFIIVFILLSFNYSFSKESSNICPVVDLKTDVLKPFFIEKKKETFEVISNNKGIISNENITKINYYYDFDINNKKQVKTIYNLVKYYDNTLKYIYNIGCSDYYIKFLIEKRSLINYPNYNIEDKSSILNNLDTFYNALNNYNHSVSGVIKNNVKVYNKKELCGTVECAKKYINYKTNSFK